MQSAACGLERCVWDVVISPCLSDAHTIAPAPPFSRWRSSSESLRKPLTRSARARPNRVETPLKTGVGGAQPLDTSRHNYSYTHLEAEAVGPVTEAADIPAGDALK
ncbi:hypothetical protein NDU88_006486 [Pleurodeles waltl]|uniref:Uncharacterized protein n=1 Tax=Pleurodeles waltl TaxID=8319 RepID=A0AAV7MHK3_PLEWA|nr:hypothetical protein NDU88_006486 [Pleurodeles waltl]